MAQYVIVLDNDWGGATVVGFFGSVTEAVTHGRTAYPMNQWWVKNDRTGEKVHDHDGMEEMGKEASQELGRFDRTARWVRDREERRLRQEQQQAEHAEAARRETMRQVAARQRNYEEERRRRRAGFRNNGRPLRLPFEDDFMRFMDEDCEETKPRTNWKKEGF